jgi:hypothetical protein
MRVMQTLLRAVLFVLILIFIAGCAPPMGTPKYHHSEVVVSAINPEQRGMITNVHCHGYVPCKYSILWSTPNTADAFTSERFIDEHLLEKEIHE